MVVDFGVPAKKSLVGCFSQRMGRGWSKGVSQSVCLSPGVYGQCVNEIPGAKAENLVPAQGVEWI